MVALELAYYMGFCRVVPLGIDHWFVSQGKMHKHGCQEGHDSTYFPPDNSGNRTLWNLSDLEQAEPGYRPTRSDFEPGRTALW